MNPLIIPDVVGLTRAYIAIPAFWVIHYREYIGIWIMGGSLLLLFLCSFVLMVLQKETMKREKKKK